MFRECSQSNSSGQPSEFNWHICHVPRVFLIKELWSAFRIQLTYLSCTASVPNQRALVSLPNSTDISVIFRECSQSKSSGQPSEFNWHICHFPRVFLIKELWSAFRIQLTYLSFSASVPNKRALVSLPNSTDISVMFRECSQSKSSGQPSEFNWHISPYWRFKNKDRLSVSQYVLSCY